MTMTKTIDSDVRTMKQMAWVMVVFLLLMIAAMAWLVVQTVVWDWDLAYAVPTFVLALALWCIALYAAVQVERIKKSHDLVTYREILSYWYGEPVDRDTEKSRRERLIPVWMKTIRFVGMMVFAAAIGYGFAMLVDRLAGEWLFGEQAASRWRRDPRKHKALTESDSVRALVQRLEGMIRSRPERRSARTCRSARAPLPRSPRCGTRCCRRGS